MIRPPADDSSYTESTSALRVLLLRRAGAWCSKFKKRCELRSHVELRDRIKILERAGEGVGQAPQRSRSKLLDPGIEIVIVHPSDQVFGSLELSLNESSINDQFCAFIRKARSLPGLDLFSHWFEVPLHSVNSDRKDVHETDVLGVLGEHGREIAVKRHVVANQDSVADGEGKAHGLVVGVSNTN